MVKVALVGLGFMGKMHLGIYDSLEHVEVAAICDKVAGNLAISELDGGGNIETSGKAIDLSSAASYTDYDAMLKAGGFDYVDICLPTHLHKDYTIKALTAGYDVFCEKPMAISGDEADEMVETAERTGKILSVGQCLRYFPFYVKIKELIDSGEYGKVVSAEFARYSMTPQWSSEDWMLHNNLSGNGGYDLHIHDVDMVLHLFGLPKAVTSTGVKAFDGGFGHLATLYSYPEITVTAVGNWVCSESFGFNMRAFIVLEKAVIELDISKPDALTVYPADGEKFVPELAEQDGYYFELKDFTEHIASREPLSIVTPRSAAESCKVTLSEIESAELGKTVEINL